MNNYPNFKNFNYTDMYNNTFSNPYDNIMNPFKDEFEITKMKNNQNTNPLYDPYNGFIRGNLFKNLYDPYMSEEPYEINPMNEQAKKLTEIDSLGFALIDLNLFLDINPDNREAINLFNNYKDKKEKLTKEYEEKYGPLTIESDSLNSFPWEWINMPWPWDN